MHFLKSLRTANCDLHNAKFWPHLSKQSMALFCVTFYTFKCLPRAMIPEVQFCVSLTTIAVTLDWLVKSAHQIPVYFYEEEKLSDQSVGVKKHLVKLPISQVYPSTDYLKGSFRRCIPWRHKDLSSRAVCSTSFLQCNGILHEGMSKLLARNVHHWSVKTWVFPKTGWQPQNDDNCHS